MEAELLIGPPDDPDRYLLDRRVAVDREAATWHGLRRIEELAIAVRVRVTHPEAGPYLETDGTLRRWRWQAELVNSLDHPAVERVRDLFVGAVPRVPGADEQGRSLAVVTNWVGGRKLDAGVGARTGADAAAIVPILRQIADVVDRLHAGVGGQTIVHRTLSPSTITVDRGRVHLEGLGSARPATATLGAVPGVAATWTPPEVLKGQPYRPEGDRWCVGALAHVLVTGSPPALLSPAETVDALLAAPILRGDPTLVGHLLRLLTPEPSMRPDSLTPWVAELSELLRLDAPPSAAPPPAPPLADSGLPSRAAVAPSGPDDEAPGHSPALRDRASGDDADDLRATLLLEWDPASLDPLLAAARPDEAAVAHPGPSLARRLLPYAAAGASLLAVLAVGVDLAGGEQGGPPTTVAATVEPEPSVATSPVAVPAPDPGSGTPGFTIDSFDEPGRTGLAGGALPWSATAGSWSVVDGVAVATDASSAGVALATVTPSAVPGSIAARLAGLVPGAGLNVRVTDASTYWAFVHLPGTDATWQLLRVADGGVETVAATAEGPTSGAVTVEVRLEGDSITGVVDGVELVTVTDPRDADVPGVGIGTAGGGVEVTTFDDLRLSAG